MSDLVSDVEHYISTNLTAIPDILGHSLGGKIAMGINHSFKQRMVVVDISPINRPISSLFYHYINEMIRIDGQVNSQKQADSILSETIPEKSIRSFLLTNLKLQDDKYKFQINLKAFKDNFNNIGFINVEKFDGPSLFIKGSHSDYIKEQDEVEIKRIFCNVDIKKLTGGHWIHAEDPQEFVKSVDSFLINKR